MNRGGRSQQKQQEDVYCRARMVLGVLLQCHNSLAPADLYSFPIWLMFPAFPRRKKEECSWRLSPNLTADVRSSSIPNRTHSMQLRVFAGFQISAYSFDSIDRLPARGRLAGGIETLSGGAYVIFEGVSEYPSSPQTDVRYHRRGWLSSDPQYTFVVISTNRSLSCHTR